MLNLSSTGRLLIRHHRRRWNSSLKASTTTASTTAMPSSRFSFSSLLSWYSNQLDRRPVLTKIISSALIAASGDIICQVIDNGSTTATCIDDTATTATATASKNEEKIVHTNKGTNDVVFDDNTDIRITTDNSTTQQQQQQQQQLDYYRTGRFFLIGAFWVAPATHLWYGFLSTRLLSGAATPKRIIQRLLIDQFGAAPIFCPTFMGLLWLLEGQKPSVVVTELIDATPTLLISNWTLWFPAMAVMFSVVPLKFQVLYSNCVGLIWSVYLSYASTRLQQSSDSDSASASSS
ncbi:MAG: hypothetical protein ACI90V_013609 [Bacillariaceae sp.]|jgi:hypothetical protein